MRAAGIDLFAINVIFMMNFRDFNIFGYMPEKKLIWAICPAGTGI